MTNLEKQADEILALQSIFDQKFRLLDHNQYEILIDFDLIQPFSIHYNNQTSTIKYLPPFSLIIHYHDEYPTQYSPSFILSCFYFSKFHLQSLCHKLDNYPFIKDEVCVYDWIELIKSETTNKIILQINKEEQMNDPRALNGYSSENLDKIYQYLINYNNEYEEKQFRNQLQTCLICTDIIAGIDCIRLHRYGHFYCQSCLNNYVKMTLENGKFGEKVLCPENGCKQPFLPNEVKLVLQNDELYERYDRLTLQHGLELMNDIVWCPRCQFAVLGGEGDDNLAMCDQCRYTFCKKCKEVFHSQTMCPKEYAIELERLRQEKERERIRKQQEEAIANLKKIEEEKKSAAEKKVATQKYREIVINLSEQAALLEEVLNAERIESLNTQYCPKCHVRIEKNGGCSHMRCSRCNHDFTWQTIEKPQVSITTSLLTYSSDNPMPIESIQKELNNEGVIVKTSEQKIEKIDSDETEENSKILINNRSAIGSAIVNRVKPCPFKSCKKLNIKVDQDNWILCRSCMKQYCFLCGRGIHGIGHFDKKCKRYTPI